MSAANENAPAETDATSGEKKERVRVFGDVESAKAAAAEANVNAKPTKSGREATRERVYKCEFPANFTPPETFYVVSKSPAQAAQTAMTQAGIVFESEETPKFVPPAAYADLLSEEQQAEMLKILNAKKKERAGK
jgi:hypothetical protein